MAVAVVSEGVAAGVNLRDVNNPAVSSRGGLRTASFIGAVLACANGPVHPPPVNAQAPPSAVRLSVGASGFQPRRVTVAVGLVHFVVTSREGDHCFAIPSLDVEKRVRASRTLEVDVMFEKPGEFPFLCCVEGPATAETGTIIAR